jgi:hypothetical protein
MKKVAVTPLEGPNTGRVIDALEKAFEIYGKPKHLITYRDSLWDT